MKNVPIYLNRILFIFVLFLSFLANSQKLSPPNILWIVSEDNSPFIGAYGDEFATTPNLDKLAKAGILYENAFAPAPVCAATRSSIITGMYANSLGTQHMRSGYPIPKEFKFYPSLMRAAGYYCTNKAKKDYNTLDQEDAWDESGGKASYKNRKAGQPFFHIINLGTTHESSIHKTTPKAELRHDPEQVPIPPYHPKTPEMKHDWAQYYDKMEDLDTEIGEVLSELKKDAEAENTIVIYYADHGGILGRSKRFMYESGLRVPLIVYLPEKYQHLAQEKPGTTTDRMVNLLDMGPTVLHIAGVKVPKHMQGKPFLGKNTTKENKAFGFRGRMDERYDMVRSLRNKEYRYIRNYMPHRIYGQHLEYLWRAPSMKSWEKAYLNGTLNKVQSAFWGEKPSEELYKISSDPHNVDNLASNPTYATVLKQMRQECKDWQKDILDIGFIPEPMIERISKEQTIYEYVRKKGFPYNLIVETADLASQRETKHLKVLLNRLQDKNAVVRYWAATGCAILKDPKAKENLLKMVNDPSVSVRIAIAEALYGIGEAKAALKLLSNCLDSELIMARTMALNVLDLMEMDAVTLLPKIETIVAEAPESRNYDIRIGKSLVEKLSKE